MLLGALAPFRASFCVPENHDFAYTLAAVFVAATRNGSLQGW